MECSKIEELLVDYHGGELSPAIMKMVEAHVVSCDNCAKALEETKSLLTTFENVQPQVPNDSLRDGFYKMLSEEKRLQEKVRPLTNNTRSNWKMAFQIAASIVLLLCGYVYGTFQEERKSETQLANLQEETAILKQEMLLALMDNKSASKRIQAVSFTSEMEASPDPEILEALIERLQFDGNVNVRLAAAEALSNYTTSEAVKTAFINSLTKEKNPTVQIAVIQFLVTVQEKRARVPMQQLLDETETPSYVKQQLNQGLQQLI